jgi:hypothetical protein
MKKKRRKMAVDQNIVPTPGEIRLFDKNIIISVFKSF